jgi:MFS family permease
MTKPDTRQQAFILWISVTQLISWGSVFYMFSLILGPIEQDLHMGRAEASLAFSLSLLMEGLMAYPVGRWIDRGHERKVMATGSLVLMVGLALHSYVQTPWQLYGVWMGLGVGCAMTLYSPAFAILTRRFPHDFRRAIIVITFLGGLASTVFIPLMAWLISHLGWRDMLWVLAALQLLVCFPIHFFVLKGAHGRVTVSALQPPSGVASAESVETADAIEQTSATHDRREPFAPILKSHAFWFATAFSLCSMAVTVALPAHMISLLQESGLPPHWVVAIPASIGAVQVAGRLVLWLFEKRLNVDQSNRWITLLLPVGLLMLIFSQGHPALALAFVVLFGLGNGMLTIVKGTLMASYVSQAHVAKLNGVIGLPIALARSASPLMLGLLWSPTGGYATGLWVLWLLSVGSVIALIGAQKTARQNARQLTRTG